MESLKRPPYETQLKEKLSQLDFDIHRLSLKAKAIGLVCGPRIVKIFLSDQVKRVNRTYGNLTVLAVVNLHEN